MLAAVAALAAANDAGLPLQVAERRVPGGLVRLADLTAHSLVVGQRVQQADALRTGEHEVETGNRPMRLPILHPPAGLEVERADSDGPLAHRLAEQLLRRRVDPPKQRPEVAVLHDA